MSKTHEELLAELEELGITKTGRKVRSDKGQPRESYVRSLIPRADKGLARKQYVQTPAYYKNLFNRFIETHAGEYDSLQRDDNLIFPPQITSYYKKITKPDGSTYRSSVVRDNHPEQLRWQWWFSELEAAADKTYWMNRICDWYFIKPEDIDAWTYVEWSWAYYYRIAGHQNRYNVEHKAILSYDAYLAGKYAFPEMDDKGNIVWRR